MCVPDFLQELLNQVFASPEWAHLLSYLEKARGTRHGLSIIINGVFLDEHGYFKRNVNIPDARWRVVTFADYKRESVREQILSGWIDLRRASGIPFFPYLDAVCYYGRIMVGGQTIEVGGYVDGDDVGNFYRMPPENPMAPCQHAP